MGRRSWGSGVGIEEDERQMVWEVEEEQRGRMREKSGRNGGGTAGETSAGGVRTRA